MKANSDPIFEHDYLSVTNGRLTKSEFKAFQSFAGADGSKFFDLRNNGVKFKSYVGVIQVGKRSFEVLPKLDSLVEDKEGSKTQKVLIQMLHQSGVLNIHTPSEANLKLHSNYILEAYIQHFLKECDQLLHRGLIKTYRKEEGNRNALKGRLMFSKHIRENLVHAERFYVDYTTYDHQHVLNRILVTTLQLIQHISFNSFVLDKARNLLMDFPEMKALKINENTFSKISWNRKSEPYRMAIQIARMLLLNYHPDVSAGSNHVLALMFNMNTLWEKWVVQRLKKYGKEQGGFKVKAQGSKVFWESENQLRTWLRPDILLSFNNGERKVVLDTKWKLTKGKPSSSDVQQMFAYNHLFGTQESYLIYPGEDHKSESGSYFNEKHKCGVELVQITEAGELTDAGLIKMVGNLDKAFGEKQST